MTRLPLRTRTSLAFGVSALVLAIVVALASYLVTRSTLVSQREGTAQRQAFVNARAVRAALDGAGAQEALSGAQVSSGGVAILHDGGEWYSSSVAVGRADVPATLLDVLREDGTAARQRLRVRDEPVVAVAVPLVDVDAEYVELVPLSEVETTLQTVQRGLALAAVVVAGLGALAGLAASARILRPVRRMSEAARGIGEGALDRRLEHDGDTDLEPLVESFNEMVDGLQARIEREARFASDVSHELRSPLATMGAALSIARRRATDPAVREALDALGGEVDRFVELVSDLLEISRAEAGIVELHREQVDPAELVRMVLAGSGHEDVPVLVDGSAPTSVAVDKRRLGQCLVNLLNNAGNYAGGATAVRVEGADDVVRIHVDDDGPGIPEHERGYVFERFARGTTSQAPDAGPGTGLGLALVKEHVALHGGTVSVSGSPDGGARFTIEVPRVGP